MALISAPAVMVVVMFILCSSSSSSAMPMANDEYNPAYKSLHKVYPEKKLGRVRIQVFRGSNQKPVYPCPHYDEQCGFAKWGYFQTEPANIPRKKIYH